jgi:uncharacterized membrane protein YbaN (DUF454 family)
VERPAPPAPDEPRLVRSRAARGALVGLGVLFVGLGVAGIFLPVLPTTPFLLLAAACFVRSSPRLYDRLLGDPTFGPIIRDWREHRSIPARAKTTALAVVALTFGTSIAFGVQATWLRAALAATGVALGVYLWRLPTRRPEADASR